MMPGSWSTRRFADVATYKAGRTPARANNAYWHDSGEGVPWVAISDMNDFGVVTKTKETVTRNAFDEVFRGQIVPVGTLLMSFKLTIGRVATLGINACHNEAIISIFPAPDINQRYLKYFLGQVDYRSLQDRQVKGNTLNRQKLDRIQISVPPPTEQAAIADVLDLVNRSVEIQDRAISATLSLKRAAMQTLFTRGLRGESQKETEIGPVPESWIVESISDQFSVVSGGTPSRRTPAFWTGGTIPWVKTTEIDYCVLQETEEHITQAGLEQSAAKLLPPETLLLAMYGNTRGKVAILGIEAACNQACAAISPHVDAQVDTKYLYQFLSFRYEAIRRLAHGGQQQNLSLNIVRDFPVARPTQLDEQGAIIAILDAIDQKADLHRRKRAVLEELFKALLHKLMTGKIRVADLDLSALGRAS